MAQIKFNTPEENALIDAASNGSHEAFEQLMTLYERFVYNTVKIKVGNSQDALDISQEVFIKMWRSIGRYRGDCHFATWIYKICTNTCLDFLRHDSHDHSVPMPTYIDKEGDEITIEFADEALSASPELSAEQNETVTLVRDAIARLPGEQREVVLLRDIEGYTYEEIAEMLSLEIGTVKSRLNRARSHLKELLSGLRDEIKV